MPDPLVGRTPSFEEALDGVMAQLQHLLLTKNKDYKDNLLYWGLRGVTVRLHDKYKRLEHLTWDGEAPAHQQETLEDTLRDMAGYSIVALVHLWMGDMTIEGERGHAAAVDEAKWKGMVDPL
jgi:hypothetical protein